MYECLIIPIEGSYEFVIQQFSVFEVIPVEESECCEVQDDKKISDIGFEIPLHDVLQEVDQEVVEGEARVTSDSETNEYFQWSMDMKYLLS